MPAQGPAHVGGEVGRENLPFHSAPRGWIFPKDSVPTKSSTKISFSFVLIAGDSFWVPWSLVSYLYKSFLVPFRPEKTVTNPAPARSNEENWARARSPSPCQEAIRQHATELRKLVFSNLVKQQQPGRNRQKIQARAGRVFSKPDSNTHCVF